MKRIGLGLTAGLATLMMMSSAAWAASGRWDNWGYMRHDSLMPAPSLSSTPAWDNLLADPDNDGEPGADMSSAIDVTPSEDSCEPDESIGFTWSAYGDSFSTIDICEDGYILDQRANDDNGDVDVLPVNRRLPDIRFTDEFAALAFFDDLKRDSGTKQVVRVDIDTVADSTLYTVTINGTDHDLMSDSTATATEIRNGLIAAINFGGEPVEAAAVDSNTFTITSDVAGTFTFAVTANLGVNETASGVEVSKVLLRSSYACGSNSCATIEWRGYALEARPNARVTFQLTLVSTGEVRFHYLDISDTTGESATIGIQDPEARSWNVYSHNTANSVSSDLLVSFDGDSDGDGLSDAFEDRNGNGSFDQSDEYDVDITTVASTTMYTITVNGTDFTITSDADALDTEIQSALIAAVNGGAEPVTASASGTATVVLVGDDMGGTYTVATSANLEATQTASPETDASNFDTDGDGVGDGGEVVAGTDPNDAGDPAATTDDDGDGLALLDENYFGTSDDETDTDGDGIDDDSEAPGTDPAFADSDNDGDDDGALVPEWDVVVDTAVDNTLYTVTVNGTDVHYTSGSGATTTTIRDGLVTAIEASTLDVTTGTPAADTVTITGEQGLDSMTVTVNANMTATEQPDVSIGDDPAPRDPTIRDDLEIAGTGNLSLGDDSTSLAVDALGNIHAVLWGNDDDRDFNYVMISPDGEVLIDATDMADAVPGNNDSDDYVMRVRLSAIPGSTDLVMAVWQEHDNTDCDGYVVLRISPSQDDQDGDAADAFAIVTSATVVSTRGAHHGDLAADGSGVAHLVFEDWQQCSGARDRTPYAARYVRVNTTTGTILSDVNVYEENTSDYYVHRKARPHIAVGGGVAHIVYAYRGQGIEYVRYAGDTRVFGPERFIDVPQERTDVALVGGRLFVASTGGEGWDGPDDSGGGSGQTVGLIFGELTSSGTFNPIPIDDRVGLGNTVVEIAPAGSDLLLGWYDAETGASFWTLVDTAGNLRSLPYYSENLDEADVDDKHRYNATGFSSSIGGVYAAAFPGGCCDYDLWFRLTTLDHLPSPAPLARTTEGNIMTATVSAITNPVGLGGGGDGGCSLSGGTPFGTTPALILVALLGAVALERRRRTSRA